MHSLCFDVAAGGKGPLALRGCMSVDECVRAMSWDANAMDGVLLTAEGSIWWATRTSHALAHACITFRLLVLF